MHAGFAEINFAPRKGYMPGGFSPVMAEGNIGKLLSSAVAIEQDGECVILISMDIVSSHAEYANDIRRRISEQTGVPASNIMVCATHCHTSTLVEYPLYMCPADEKVTSRTADRTVEAAVRAYRERRPARLGAGKTYEARFSFCRDFYTSDGSVMMNNPRGLDSKDLLSPISSPDHSVNVMRIDDESGKPKCFIVNFACHADCHSKKKKYSADFPGYMRRKLKRIYGREVVVLFLNGAAGDVNCIDNKYKTHRWYYGADKIAAKTIGEELARDIQRIEDSIFVDVDRPVISSISRHYTAKRRVRSEEQRREAEALLERAKTEELTKKQIAFATDYASDFYKSASPTYEMEIHTVQIGPWALVGIPSEVYSETGHKIKAASPYINTIVVELANGNHGYIPPDRIMASDVYEAQPNINGYVDFGMSDMLVEKSAEQLRDLSANGENINFEKI